MMVFSDPRGSRIAEPRINPLIRNKDSVGRVLPGWLDILCHAILKAWMCAI
jgi:hypothetical protein